MPRLIKDLKAGEEVTGFFAVVEKEKRYTRDNKPYLNLVLQDKTGRIDAKLWDCEELESTFEKNQACAVKGIVESYNNQLQINVRKIRPATDEDREYGFDLSNLVLTTEKDIDEMWLRLKEIRDLIENPFLKKLCDLIYEEWEEQLKTHPASKKLHHAYRGGLLEHTHSMSELALGICKCYTHLNRDWLLTGVLIHDIGKLKELKADFSIEYTPEGRLVGHIVLGTQMVREVISRIPDFPQQLALVVEHLILAHQGKKEWDSPREPTIAEALILHYIDEMDAKNNMFQYALNNFADSEGWTTNSNYFRRPLWNPLLEADEDSPETAEDLWNNLEDD